jgi:hypothetical protein
MSYTVSDELATRFIRHESQVVWGFTLVGRHDRQGRHGSSRNLPPTHRGYSLYLVISNGSWSHAVPCTVRLRNFRARHATGILLTNDQPDAKPLLEHKQDAVSDFAVQLAAEDATCVILPHAVVFVTLTQ